MRYVVWGWTVVFDPEGKVVAERAVLRDLSTFVDDDDLFATDYLADTGVGGTLTNALERSGQLRFALHDGEELLRVFNEYLARRELEPAELQMLREYTLGQWSDGMGECVFVPRGPYKDYKLQPLDGHDIANPEYPFVEIRCSSDE